MLNAVESTQGTCARFEDTHWSVVLAARDEETSRAAVALEKLCRAYWLPLYAFARRRASSPEDAQDLTQEFLADLIARRDLTRVDPAKGKFRSFLLASLKHFLANDWRARQTLKRGGGVTFVPLEVEHAEERLAASPAPEVSAERLFDQRWALAVMDQALDHLRRELAAARKENLFHELKRFLTLDVGDGKYEAVSARRGMTSAAVATT
jgi:RNA polymerase sigma factor (sigma-70 family)